MKTYVFTVTGKSRFPLDMLRYDSCWPSRSDDVSRITDLNDRAIRLVSHKEPTEGRWQSFGWQLGKVTVLKP